MNAFCPNFSNKKVKQEFDELIEIFGEDQAYLLWHRTNGNGMELAPNGANSKLFQSLLEHYNGDHKKAIIAKAKTLTDEFFNWFGNWTGEKAVYDDEGNRVDQVSKITDENGEPLVVYHNTPFEFNGTFDMNHHSRLSKWITEPFGHVGTKETADKISGTQYALFANIKNPLKTPDFVHETVSSMLSELYKQGLISREKYSDLRGISNQQLRDLMKELGYDGTVYENKAEKGGVSYSFINPNQIKSIDNEGQFSTENNNIYHNLLYENPVTSTIQQLQDLHLIHTYKNGKMVTKTNGMSDARTRNEIDRICRLNGVVADITPKGLATFFAIDSYDTIPPNTKDIREINEVVEFLQQRFPGLKVQWVPKSFIKAKTGQNSNAYVEDSTVYLSYEGTTSDIAAEELLHPFVTALQMHNPELFNALLSEAKLKLPKLVARINNSYTDKKGFKQSTRDNEIVTQTLARYFVKEHRETAPKSIRNLVNKFLNWLSYHFSSFISGYGNYNYVYSEDIPNMTFKDLASLLNTTDTIFSYQTSSDKKHNLDPAETATNVTKAFNDLYRAYQRMPNKSKRREQIQNNVYETLTKLKTIQDFESAQIAVDFALESLGVLDINTALPQGYDPSNPATYTMNMWAWLLSEKSKGFSGLTADNVVNMYKNNISFYENLYNTLHELIVDSRVDASTRNKIQQLSVSIQSVKDLWKEALVVVSDKIVDEKIDLYVTAPEQERENMKVVYKDWLHRNMFYGDISAIEKYAGNYGQSTNPIVKLAFHLIQAAQTKTQEEASHEAAKIDILFNKANKLMQKINPAWQTIFMEKDRNGIPTGRFVRDKNYGQYEQDLNTFVQGLNDEFDNLYGYHYEQDETGEWINSATGSRAEDEQWGTTGNDDADMPVYVKYQLTKEKWVCDHAERRYTFEYYKERLSRPYNPTLASAATGMFSGDIPHGLSPKTLSKYNHIQSNINYYLDKCTDPNTGFAKPEKLSFTDKLKLDMWRDQLDDLSNPFNYDGSMKVDDEFDAAMEIQSWQKWIGDKLNTKTFFYEYQTEYNEVLAEATSTGNQQLLDDFVKYNTRYGINPNFMFQTIGQWAKNAPQSVQEVYAQIMKASLSRLTSKEGTLDKDVERFENNPMFWLQCKQMDEILEQGRVTSDPDFVKMFTDNFYIKQTLYTDSNGNYIDRLGRLVTPQDVLVAQQKGMPRTDLVTYQEYLVKKYQATAKANKTIDGLIDPRTNVQIDFTGWSDSDIDNFITDMFTYKRSYVDKNGNLRTKDVPLSIFGTMMPVKDSFVNYVTGLTEPTVLNVPIGRFSKKDDKLGQYVNPNYDITSGESVQPNYMYDNEDFKKIHEAGPDIENLYYTLIDVMKEYKRQCFPNEKRFDYKLPQINAANMAILSRVNNLGAKKVGSILLDSVTAIQENDSEMRTQDSYITNPDGSRSLSIPTRFMQDLKDPATITTDITGAVKMFVHMACNYKNSQAIESNLEALMYSLDSNNRDPKESNDAPRSLAFYKQMLEKHYYDNQWDVTELDSRAKVALNKFIRTAHRSGTLQMLAFNFLSMGVGFLDQMSRIFTEAVLGKHVGRFDFLLGVLGTIKDLPWMIKNLGSPLANNLTTALMQVNGISKDFHRTHTGTSRNKVRKFLGNILMGGFSALDYFGNACLLRSKYNSYKLYEGYEIPQGFYTKQEMISAFIDAGYSPKDSKKLAKKHTSLSTKTLLGAYEFRDGSAYVKPQYEQYVSDRVKTQVRSFTMQRGALYAGVNPDNDTPGYKSTILGWFIGAMRGWMTQQMEHLFVGGDETSIREFDENKELNVKHGVTKSKSKKIMRKRTAEQKAMRMAWNFETGAPQDEIALAIFRSIPRLFKIAWNAASFKLKSGKKVLSDVEKYAWKDFITYTAFTIILGCGWPSIHKWANQVKAPIGYSTAQKLTPGHTRDANLARRESSTFMPWEDGYWEYELWKLQIDDMYFRIFESKLANQDPTTAYDIINQLTVLSNAYKEQTSFINAAVDLTGLSGHEPSEVLKQGVYKNWSRGERDLYKMIGPLDNLHTGFSYWGLKYNLSFYTKKYGGIFNAFGVDTSLSGKKEDTKSKKKSNNNNNLGASSLGSSGFGASGLGSSGI